jgi:hypothetical protein
MVLEMFESMKDSMVLRGRSNKMAAARRMSPRNTQDGKVARFGSAGGEDYLMSFDPKKAGKPFPRTVNRRSSLPAGCVNAGRIAEIVAQKWHHFVKRLRGERCRGVVI